KRELLAKANAALEAPATLATPSGAQTDPAPPQLADTFSSDSTPGQRVTEAEAGATMTPVVEPVAEAVARSSSAESAASDTTSPDSVANPSASTPEYNAAQAEVDAIAEKPQRTADQETQNGHSQDAPHDYKPA